MSHIPRVAAWNSHRAPRDRRPVGVRRLVFYSILALYGVLVFFGACGAAHAWTDTITSDTTSIRKVHIDELRTAVDNKRVEYGFTAYSYNDSTLTADTTLIRAVHVTDLRTAIGDIETYYASCISASSWTDTLTADQTMVRGVHITELRTAVDSAITCRNCCGLCKDCKGSGGCNNQSAGNDVYNDCTATSCATGNCDGAGACQYSGAGTEGSPACSVCYDCNGSGSCTAVTNGVADVGCDLTASAVACLTANQTCNGSGSCNFNYAASGAEGGAVFDCAVCKDCDGAGNCVNVSNGVNDVGCNGTVAGNACLTADQTCNGSGSCNTNYASSGTEGTCAVCQDCNGSGACGNVTNGLADIGCNTTVAGSNNCVTADQTCNGSGSCNTNYASSGAEGTCAVCQDCNGSGACANVTNGVTDVGCNLTGDCLSADQTCNGSGSCNYNFLGSGTGCGSGTCEECDGAGTCLYTNSGVQGPNCTADCYACDGAGSCSPLNNVAMSCGGGTGDTCCSGVCEFCDPHAGNCGGDPPCNIV